MERSIFRRDRFARPEGGPVFGKELQSVDCLQFLGAGHAFTSAPVKHWNTTSETFASSSINSSMCRSCSFSDLVSESSLNVVSRRTNEL